MNIGDKVSFLDALVYMRDNPGSVFEDEKAQYTLGSGGDRLAFQHRSDSPPYNYGGDWHLTSGWTTWSAYKVLNPKRTMTCTKI